MCGRSMTFRNDLIKSRGYAPNPGAQPQWKTVGSAVGQSRHRTSDGRAENIASGFPNDLERLIEVGASSAKVGNTSAQCEPAPNGRT